MEWTIIDHKLTKEFTCDNFVDAVEFVKEITQFAEELNHHPDILIHAYKQVKIMLSTHDENKVTQKDYDLAKRIDILRE